MVQPNKRIWIFAIIVVLIIMANQGDKQMKKEAGEIVSRTLPSEVNLNEEVTITLTGSSLPSSYFAIVRDDIPTGWSYVSGGAVEGNQVKAIITSLSGSAVSYVLKAPSSVVASTFAGTYQFSDAPSTSTIVGDTTVSVISAPTCSGSCKVNSCGTYDSCSVGTGSCATGYCCSGSCTAPPTPGEVVRTLPSSAGTNQEVDIDLTAQNTDAEFFAIVRDNIPTGWTYVSGGSQEGTQVKSIISSLTGNSVTYTLKTPSSATTSTFSGTYQFTGAETTSSILGDTSITISGTGCTPSCTYPDVCSESVSDGCGDTCTRDTDGTACTGGTCENGVCKSSLTCGELAGNACTSGQTCSEGGEMTVTSDTDLCCVGGTCEDPPEETCEEIKKCEFYESCNTDETKCEIAPWVFIVGGVMAFMMFWGMVK